MSTTQHTPGPWTINKVCPWTINHLLYDEPLDNKNVVCRMPDRNPETEANARLIVAAPELLEALETCVSELNQLAFLAGDKLANAAIEKGIEAIRKAKGGAQ